MATNTHVALATTTLGSAGVITFNSISSSYTDLVLVVSNVKSTASTPSCSLRVGNGSVDTGSNYSDTVLEGNGTSATSNRQSSQTRIEGGYNVGINTNGNGGVYIYNFQNYSNTSTYKTIIWRGNTPDGTAPGTIGGVGLWRSTSAINTIEISGSGANLASGTVASLYGIKAEGASGTKATGGAVYSDATYFYHVFGATETFTPSQSLTASVLVVGTGGVGGVFAGGGGAGGSIGYSASVSLASGTAYTATIGASGTIPKVNSSGSKVQSATASTNCTFSGGAISTITGTAGGNGSDTGAGGSNTAYSGGSGTGGGGAGFGAAGSAGPGGAGGTGVSTYSSWGVATGLGENVSGTYYFAGGGGGGTSSGSSSGAGGSGGGGAGAADGLSGTRYTGGGGGGAKNSPNYGDGGSGGLGVVIVRYAKA